MSKTVNNRQRAWYGVLRAARVALDSARQGCPYCDGSEAGCGYCLPLVAAAKIVEDARYPNPAKFGANP